MPNVNRGLSPYVGSGNPDTYSVATAYAPGDLGNTFDWNDRTYQSVRLDSGASASSPAGAVAANQLAYWKDRANYVVTNDSRFALFNGVASSFRNNVAGVFRSAVTAGNYCFVLQRGRQVNVAEAGSATEGMVLVCSTSTTAATALGVAIGTAPTCLPLGVVTTATSNGVAVADMDIPNIP